MGLHLAFYLNEAQTVVPSQTMVGGLFSSQKYGSAIDVSDLVLQFRGLGLHVIALTQMPGQLKSQFPSQQSALMVFHSTNDNDINYAFGDIPNEEMQTNLKMLVKNKFVKDQHMFVFKFGPEADQIKIILSAMSPCAIERPDMDVFELYHKLYPTETVPLKQLLSEIEEQRKQNALKSLEFEIGEGLVKVLEEGKTLVPVSSEQIVINKEDIEKIAVPPDHVVVPKELVEADAKKVILDEDKTVVDKDLLKRYEQTVPVGEDKIVIDKDKYEKLILDYELPTLDELQNGSRKKDVKDLVKILVIACNPFKLCQTESHQKEIVDMLQSKQMFHMMNLARRAMAMPERYPDTFGIFKSLIRDPLLSKVFSTERIGRTYIYSVLKLGKKWIEKQLGQEYCQKVYNYCALKLYDKLPELPWCDEVIKINNKLKSEIESEENKNSQN
jgi:hypothetical protein